MLELELFDFYQQFYRPDKHATPKQINTRKQFETDLRIFDQAFRFHLAERGERLRSPRLSDLAPPAAGAATLHGDDLLKHAMGWQLARGRTKETANRLYRTICAIWRDAFDRGWLPAPPRTKKYGESKRKPQCWSLEEFAAIVAAAEATDGWIGQSLARVFMPAYCWCTYSIGSRQSVTLNVPTVNFDERRGAVLLPAELQKQDSDQWMELLPEAVEAIARLQSRQRRLDRLFGDWSGSITNFNKRLRKIIVAAGLRERVEDVTRWDLSHKIRRTFATHACANSDEETVRQLLGHSHVSVTRRYLDDRFLPRVSARNIVPPLRPRPTDPDPPPPDVRIYRPEAG